MPNYIFNGYVLINGSKISCRISGEPGSDKDRQPYVLCMPASLGACHANYEKKIEDMHEIARKHGVKPFHFITFDYPGCGDSEPGNPDKDYTIDGFTEIAACLIEKIKNYYHLDHIDLLVDGAGFGAMIAMNLPALRPGWIKEDAEIKLQRIILQAAAHGYESYNAALEYLDRDYRHHPNYAMMREALLRFNQGDIKNQKDYVQNIMFMLAPLYADQFEQAANSPVAKLLRTLPDVLIPITDMGARLGVQSCKLGMCAIKDCVPEVHNHFFKNRFYGFNVEKTVRHYPDLYKKIPVICLAGDRDYALNSTANAEQLHRLLPDNVAIIIFNAKTNINRAQPDAFAEIQYHVIMDAHVDVDRLNKYGTETVGVKPAIVHYNLPDQFIPPRLRNSSTMLTISRLGMEAANVITQPESGVRPDIVHDMTANTPQTPVYAASSSANLLCYKIK